MSGNMHPVNCECHICKPTPKKRKFDTPEEAMAWANYEEKEREMIEQLKNKSLLKHNDQDK